MGQQISSTIYIGAPTDLNNPEMMKERLELEMYASGYAIGVLKQPPYHIIHKNQVAHSSVTRIGEA